MSRAAKRPAPKPKPPPYCDHPGPQTPEEAFFLAIQPMFAAITKFCRALEAFPGKLGPSEQAAADAIRSTIWDVAEMHRRCKTEGGVCVYVAGRKGESTGHLEIHAIAPASSVTPIRRAS